MRVPGGSAAVVTRTGRSGSARPGARIVFASMLCFGLSQLCGHLSHAQERAVPLIESKDGDRVSGRIQAASLQDTLQEFSDATGVEIVISGSADETISVEFEDLRPEEALRTILGERSSISFYAAGASGTDGAAPRLTKVWIFKGVAGSSNRGEKLAIARRPRRSTPTRSPARSNPFENLKRQALTDKSPDRRKRAIEGLIASDGEKAKSALVQALLNDKDPEVRQAALDNLLWYDDEAPRQPLIKAALRDSSPQVRRLAIEEGFADLAEDDPAARRVLIQALGDKDREIRLVVVEALGELADSSEDNRDLKRALVRALNDEDEAVRLAAIEPLEETRAKSALSKAAKNDPSERVQEAAREALANLE